MSAVVRVSEIFGPTIQGEGPHIGTPTVFVRVGGCDYRCSWCDTPYAVLPEHRATWTPMRADAIAARVQALAGGPILVTLSGGNPALYELAPLVDRLHAQGHRVLVETQGSLWRDWLTSVDALVVSPKPPSSGMATEWGILERFVEHPAMAFKVVVGDTADYAYAENIARRWPTVPMYLQPCNLLAAPSSNTTVDARSAADASLAMMRRVVEWVRRDGWHTVRVLPQLHLLLWGPVRGV